MTACLKFVIGEPLTRCHHDERAPRGVRHELPYKKSAAGVPPSV